MSTPAQKIYKRLQREGKVKRGAVAVVQVPVVIAPTRARSVPGVAGTAQKIYKRIQKKKKGRKPRKTPVIKMPSAAADAPISRRSNANSTLAMWPIARPSGEAVRRKVLEEIDDRLGDLESYVKKEEKNTRVLRPLGTAASKAKTTGPIGQRPRTGKKKSGETTAQRDARERVAEIKKIYKQRDDEQAAAAKEEEEFEKRNAKRMAERAAAAKREEESEKRYAKRMAEIAEIYKGRIARIEDYETLAKEVKKSLAGTPSFMLVNKTLDNKEDYEALANAAKKRLEEGLSDWKKEGGMALKEALASIKEEPVDDPVVRILPYPHSVPHPAREAGYVNPARGYAPGTARADMGEQRPYLDAFGEPIVLTRKKKTTGEEPPKKVKWNNIYTPFI